jgi:hypothetical protein
MNSMIKSMRFENASLFSVNTSRTLKEEIFSLMKKYSNISVIFEAFISQFNEFCLRRHVLCHS